jgi:hypothetical protein
LRALGSEPLGLSRPRLEHLGAPVGGRRSRRHLGELGERNGGDLDVQIDAIEQRAGDFALVP